MKKLIKPAFAICVLVCAVIIFGIGVSIARYITKVDVGSISLSVLAKPSNPVTSISDLRIDPLPDTTVYAVGDDFDSTGMIVWGKLSKGNLWQEIFDYTLSNHQNLKLGQSSVGVSYDGYSAEVGIDVGYRLRYDANGGLFSNGSNHNDLIYGSAGTSTVTKISKTDNVADDGSLLNDNGYGDNQQRIDVVTIPGAESLTVTITYATESVYFDWIAVYDGTVTPTPDNANQSISGPLGDEPEQTKTFVIDGDTVQFYVCSDESVSDYYGYYAIVEGVGQSNAILLGEYEEPMVPSGEFLGWYLDEMGSIPFDNGLISENTTVYAKYDINNPVKLEIVIPPSKTEYELGDQFDSTNMGVRVVYSDGTKIMVDDFDIIDGDDLFAGQESVTISWTDAFTGITISTEQPISVFFDQVIYCSSDKSLRWVHMPKLKAGDIYRMQTVADVWSGHFEDDVFMSKDDQPWAGYSDVITKVRFDEPVAPVSTAYWFTDMTACTSIFVQDIDMSGVRDATEMFNGCIALKKIDFRNNDLSNLEYIDDMFADCDAVKKAFVDTNDQAEFLNSSLNKPDGWNFILMPDEHLTPEEFDRSLSDWVLYYINQYRVEEGAAELIPLPGLTLVAEYRADQLLFNYDHDGGDIQEAYDYYKYGDYLDLSQFGSDSYYAKSSQEAIVGQFGYNRDYIDAVGEALYLKEMGADIARAFHTSSKHWSYLGSPDNIYVGVGVEFDADTELGYNCVIVTDQNYESDIED